MKMNDSEEFIDAEEMADIVKEEQEIYWQSSFDQTDISLTEAELNDITTALSNDMWITDSSNDVRLNLKQSDKDTVLGTGGFPRGWLNDTIIDAASALLKKQFPLVGGLQSTLYAAKPQFTTPTAPFCQIVNLDARGSGIHCILLTNIDCQPGYIKIYYIMIVPT